MGRPSPASLDECKLPTRIHYVLLSPQWPQTVSSESSCTQTSCLGRGSSLSILCCLLLCSGILLSVLFKCSLVCLFCLGVFWDFASHFVCIVFEIPLPVLFVLFKYPSGVHFLLLFEWFSGFCFPIFIFCSSSFWDLASKFL